MNKIMAIIETCGTMIDPEQDINTKEALTIIHGSGSRMELVENCYLYGYMRGSYGNTSGSNRSIPVYDIPQMTDEEWRDLAARSRERRMVQQ